MNAAPDQQILTTDLETALTALVKLTKALTFYPVGHPSLVTAAEETCNEFQLFLSRHRTRPYHVTQEGFCLDAAPLASNNQSLKKLALKLVERRVRHLLFLPELADHELLIFAEELTKPAAQLLAEGGLAKRLAKRQIKSIWVNETDLEAILNNLHKMELEAPQVPAQEPATNAENIAKEQELILPTAEHLQTTLEQMRDLLEQLKEVQETQTYEHLLEQVRQLADDFFHETGIAGCLAVFCLLENHRKDNTRNPCQRRAAENLIELLLTGNTQKILVDAIAEKSLKASQRRALAKLLTGLKMKIAPQLLERLYAERDAIIRRHYTSILARMGAATFELLQDALQSNTWHVVRNAVTVLGETRLEAALPLLTMVIDHPEMRVRRSIIWALGAIGSSSVIPLLINFAKDSNQELHQPAIMTIGTLQDPLAIPPLGNLLKKSDPLGKQTQLKIDIIRALVTIRSPQAIIPLLKLARRSNLLNRKNIEILRAEAILAVAQLGNNKLIPILEQLPKANKGPVSRAIKQATTQLRKQKNVT